MSASMVGAVSRRSGTEVFVEPIGEGYAIYAGPGSPFNKDHRGRPRRARPIDESALDRAERIFDAHGAAARAEICVLASPDVFAVFNRRGYRFETVEHVLGLRLPPASDVVVAAAGPPRRIPGGRGVRLAAVDRCAGGGVCRSRCHRDRGHRRVVPGRRPAGDLLELRRRDGLPPLPGAASTAGSPGAVASSPATASASCAARRRSRASGGRACRRRCCAGGWRMRPRQGCDLAVVTTAPGSKSQQNAQRQGFALLYARAVLVRAA